MRMPEKSLSTMVSINSYKKYGLREKNNDLWISALVELGDNFFPWRSDHHPLGNKMVESARKWFIQSNLIYESNKKITPLVDLFKKNGGAYSVGWEFIWLALVNNATLIKWFVTATELGIPYSPKQLSTMLAACYPSLGVTSISGGLQALKDMLTKSPLGDKKGIVSLEMKGKSIVKITRQSKEVSSLSILYGLYLIAKMTNRSCFTIRELLSSNMDSNYISPIIAFGIPAETFKRQCEGLRSKYPEYISTTFTHGNDGIDVYPQNFNTENIITLAMEE